MTCQLRLISIFPFGLFYTNFLILTAVPESFSLSYEMVLPKIEIELACIFQDMLLLSAKCVKKQSSKAIDTSIVFPVLDKNNSFVFDDDQDSYVGIQCTAPYPVEWTHFQERWLELTSENWAQVLRATGGYSMRSVKSLNDTSTFTYSSFLTIHNLKSDANYIVGQYTCQSVEPSSLPSRASTQMTVYRKRKVYDQAFPLWGRNITVWMNDQSNENTIVLPCHVSYPNVTVKLYKQIVRHVPLKGRKTPKKPNLHQPKQSISPSVLPKVQYTVTETWDPIIYPNDQLWYRPDQGFIYRNKAEGTENKFNRFQLSPGIYKCAAVEPDAEEDEINEFILITLKPGNKQKEPTDLKQEISPGGKAKFTYSMSPLLKTIKIKCCSNSSQPPTMYLMSCFSKSACNNQLKHFPNLGLHIHGPESLLSVPLFNCRHSVHISRALLTPLNTKCLGDGIDYTETFIFPLENNTPNNGMQPYLRWEDVDPYKMITLEPVNWNEKTADKRKVLIYRNQTITFRCTTNIGYFSIGNQATMGFRNGTEELIKQNANLLGGKWGLPKHTLDIVIRLNNNNELTFVSCYAPLANSKKWIKKTVEVQVEDGEAVKITASSEIQEIYLALNDTSKALKCEFSGIPIPLNIKWRKDNQIITFINDAKANYNHSLVSQNTSILVIKVATYDVHGEYQCEVSNMFDSATKTFQIYVRAPESGWIFMSASLGLGCFAVALILLGIYTWRERKLLISMKR